MFSLNETTLLSALKSRGLLSAINSAINPGWGITYNKVDALSPPSGAVPGQAVFTPDGWISAEPAGEAAIVSSPVERGSYTSYNKVRRPSELRVVFSLEGWTAYSGAVPNLTSFSTRSRRDLLETLEEMKNSTCTYDIETPDRVYQGYDLSHYDYAISAARGLTLLTVSATFQEVMDVGEVSIASDSDSSAPGSNGTSSRDTGIKTEHMHSQVKAVSMDDVKKAWTSGNASLSGALATTGSGIVSGVNSAAQSVGKAWDQATTGIGTQLKKAVSDFVKVVL
ncbi:hypothetical protein ABW11_21015 [Pluralibacter gergoviae]|uniref:phage baseplate protein n=1 Tax=Pluralibacter gergoviae TaxID=61647 RepID=UPI0006504FCD|nr:hypothetical protein [Pluralibacter gergoviae]KMK23094.1 hypothetical protein ABW11_21015 [Pluralibacter gergoviae]